MLASSLLSIVYNLTLTLFDNSVYIFSDSQNQGWEGGRSMRCDPNPFAHGHGDPSHVLRESDFRCPVAGSVSLHPPCHCRGHASSD